ncbi:NAD(P)-dependent oxidoreductase [Arthrobacter sp. PAMC 25486]|uniref:NAD(P)-dependent oxidoreductase n=1 Tax=Arthrobacter sp. PAMC 25486 TaxID=1494608 RepID=UPI0012FEEA4E|nr:NAD(P)-dependent oxidoreductase [Arthrobacter sp. PAMC 25486]
MTTHEQSSPDRRISVVVGVPADKHVIGAIKNVDSTIDVRHDRPLDPAALRRMLVQAEVIFGIPAGTPAQLKELLDGNAGLRWVHATNQDELERLQNADLSDETRERIQLTGPGGSHAAALAEFAMLGLLTFAKQGQKAKPGTCASPGTDRPSELAGQTLLVVGLGRVGAEVARLGKAFGMRVMAMTRTGNGQAPHVDELRPARFLGDMLPVSHAVVLALPQNEQTTGLLGTGAIRKMRHDAILVNVGHGGVLDGQALIEGLEQGQPAAVLLDAYSAAQLPGDSALRSMPNVLISPHAAADTRQENARNTERFTANLRRYLRGERLSGLVLPTA